MTQHKIHLPSDNWAPVHPEILNAVIEANSGYAASCGNDLWTAEAQKVIQNAFQSQCKIFMVRNGTGSNVLALQLVGKKVLEQISKY